MQQLANAIALEVGFRAEYWFASSAFETVNAEGLRLRAKYIASEVEELRINSALPVETRAITSDFVARAVAFKVAQREAVRMAPVSLVNGFCLVRKGTTEFATNLRRWTYERRPAAAKVAQQMNRLAVRESNKVEVMDHRTRLLNVRMRLVRSAHDGALVLERNDTQFTSSVASESYWCA